MSPQDANDAVPWEYTAAHVIAAREVVGLSQKEAAALAGVSRRTWEGWERGRTVSPEYFEWFLLRTGQFKFVEWRAPEKALQRGYLVFQLVTGKRLTLYVTQGAVAEIVEQIREAYRRR